MPATIGDILKTKPELVTTTPDRPLYEALELMLRYDYSQLPVLDSAGRVVGMITSDSILRALHHFGVTAREPKTEAERARHLRVQDAMQREVQRCGREAEVFTVHRQLRDASGVLVVDDKGLLIGIVTGYDTTEYLRQRVQDIVFVQDIEETIKDYVRLAFRQADGSINEGALQQAMRRVAGDEGNAAAQVMPVLAAYVQLKEGNGAQLDQALAHQALAQRATRSGDLAFDKLSLDRFVKLLLLYGLPKYGQVFQLDRTTIETMLTSVRDTRNDLAHLRIDISARQRDELHLCRGWLKHYYEDARALVLAQLGVAAPSPDLAAPAENLAEAAEPAEALNGTAPAAVVSDEQTPQVDEERVPGESRYTPLAEYLYQLPANRSRVTLTFSEIERIIGGPLPASAHEYRAWWSNDTSRQAQAEQWLSAGWRTDEVDQTRGFVTFSRLQPREQAYIEFFDAMMRELRSAVGDAYRLSQPTRVGYYWQSVTRVPDGAPMVGYTTFSFTRARRPRVDLYIDTGSRAQNKAIFDGLFVRRAQIEADFGGPLEWERIDDKRASRIAVYYDRPIDIHASPEALAELRAWGVDMLVRLKRALDEPVREVLSVLSSPENATSR